MPPDFNNVMMQPVQPPMFGPLFNATQEMLYLDRTFAAHIGLQPFMMHSKSDIVRQFTDFAVEKNLVSNCRQFFNIDRDTYLFSKFGVTTIRVTEIL